MANIVFEYDDNTIIEYSNIDDRVINSIDKVVSFMPFAIPRDLTERGYVLESGEYCWQECCSTDMCKECARLNNGRMDYFDNTFAEKTLEQSYIDATILGTL